MKKMLIALSALTVVMGLFFAGCGDKEDGKITTDASSTTSTTMTTTSTTEELSRTSDSTTDDQNMKDKVTSVLTDLTTLMDD